MVVWCAIPYFLPAVIIVQGVRKFSRKYQDRLHGKHL